MNFMWADAANETIRFVAQRQQALAQQIRTNVQQWAQNNSAGWAMNQTYSHSFNSGGYHYRAEYRRRMGNGGNVVIHIDRVEMD